MPISSGSWSSLFWLISKDSNCVISQNFYGKTTKLGHSLKLRCFNYLKRLMDSGRKIRLVLPSNPKVFKALIWPKLSPSAFKFLQSVIFNLLSYLKPSNCLGKSVNYWTERILSSCSLLIWNKLSGIRHRFDKWRDLKGLINPTN